MTQRQRASLGVGAPRQSTAGTQRTVGILLLVPAALAWIAYQVLPVLRTLWLSVRQTGIEGGGEFVGMENFSTIPVAWFAGTLVQLLLGLLIAAVAVAVGMGLGALARRTSIGWQRVTLATVGLGLVTYAPVNLLVAEFWGYGEPSSARLLLAMVPIPVMIGVLAAALARSSRLLLVIGAVTALGGAAWAGQGEGGILYSPVADAPGAFIYRSTFSMFDVGLGAAASTIMGGLLGLLGLGAGLMVLAIRPRFDLLAAGRSGAVHGTAAGPSGQGAAGRGILAAVASVAVLAVLLVLALPWLPHVGSSVEGLDPALASRATWSTVGRRALEAVLTLLVTGAAAIGLGYLRPFGRHSLRALLVVSPWLFVGLVPLITGLYFRSGGLGEAPSTPFFGITAQMFVIPLLFLLTYLADGARTARDTGQRLPIRALAGLVVLGLGIVTLARSQEVVWDLAFLYEGGRSGLQLLFQALSMQFGQTIPLGLVTPVALLVLGGLVLAAAAALVPGVRLVPAAELAGAYGDSGQPEYHQQQYGQPEYHQQQYGQPVGGYSAAAQPAHPQQQTYPQPAQQPPAPGQLPGQPHPGGPWTNPHR